MRSTALLGLALIAAATLQWPANAHANPLAAVRVGLLDHATQLTSSGIEDGTDLNLELLFKPSVVPLNIPGSPYVVVGTSFNDDADNTDQLYGGLMWEWMFTRHMFIHFGDGLAIHDGELDNDPNDDQRALGQRILLRGSVEIGRRLGRHHALAIVYDHISNGPFGGSNQGLDNFGIRYSYRF